ncbi:hypothetical protein M422DRAFT_231592 [Sphaerobolus stellatus SS14]|uniref:medium-chain acyl-CoA ligase n=1 Tax=Sphaerobolus stellatus (strain SS14) TaxID=990650 RepID=A0A0C9U3T7_SPHS4|nr:hypothetical protein M422DRAFT_231592 [Sphaerobolus stellatus SS14]
MAPSSASPALTGPPIDYKLPDTFNFASDVIDKWAQDPSLKAMIWTSRQGIGSSVSSRRDLTYEDFSERSHRVAKWLGETLGITKGDRIMIMLPRVAAWWDVLLATIRIGAVIIPCTTLLTPKDIEYRLSVGHAKVFVTDKAGAMKLTKVQNKGTLSINILVEEDGSTFPGWHSFYEGVERNTKTGDRVPNLRTTRKDPCIIYFTSGTTGYPKMVLHNHISYPLALKFHGQYWYRLSPHKVFWNLSENGWAKAAWATFGTWNMGATLFIQDDRGAFSVDNLIDTLHNFEITHLCAPPTSFRQLVLPEKLNLMTGPRKPKALTNCLAGGEALNPYVTEIWKKTMGMDIHEAYGQTETTLVCASIIGYDVRPGSMGVANPTVPFAIIDDEGNILPTNKEGNIAILTSKEPRLPWLFDGYVQASGELVLPELINPKTGQRWFLSGDRAVCDEDGYYWFVGRSDDVINTAGYRVGPFEIESCLKEHPAVIESAVVTSPDKQRGEIIKAFIVLTDEYKKRLQGQGNTQKAEMELAKEIENFVAENTAPYKKPREIEFVDTLPKTISGKIKRVELRATERQRKGVDTRLGKGAKL